MMSSIEPAGISLIGRSRSRRTRPGAPWRADLYGQTPARFFIATDRGHGFLDVQERAIVQGADQLLGLDPVGVEQGSVDVLTQPFGLGGHQIATYPAPDRLKRYAC